MRALANGGPTAASTTADPTRALVDAITASLGELERHPIGEMAEDVELAELIGRLKALLGMLISVADR